MIIYPTKTRLKLLIAIAKNQVIGEASTWWIHGVTKVTAALTEQQLAGWVRPATPPGTGRIRAEITPQGRAVLSGTQHCGGCGVLDVDGLPTTVCLHTTSTHPGVCLDRECVTWDLCERCWTTLTSGAR